MTRVDRINSIIGLIQAIRFPAISQCSNHVEAFRKNSVNNTSYPSGHWYITDEYYINKSWQLKVGSWQFYAYEMKFKARNMFSNKSFENKLRSRANLMKL